MVSVFVSFIFFLFSFYNSFSSLLSLHLTETTCLFRTYFLLHTYFLLSFCSKKRELFFLNKHGKFERAKWREKFFFMISFLRVKKYISFVSSPLDFLDGRCEKKKGINILHHSTFYSNQILCDIKKIWKYKKKEKNL